MAYLWNYSVIEQGPKPKVLSNSNLQKLLDSNFYNGVLPVAKSRASECQKCVNFRYNAVCENPKR